MLFMMLGLLLTPVIFPIKVKLWFSSLVKFPNIESLKGVIFLSPETFRPKSEEQ